MATTRSLSTASLARVTTPAGHGPRHRLRAVSPDEPVSVADLLPPGATWLPAPQHALPTLPGQPPMVGYLVLFPADQQPPLLAAAGPRAATGPQSTAPGRSAAGAGAENATAAGTGTVEDPLIRIDTVQRTAEVDGRQLDLTYLEFELLAHLVAHPGRVHTRDQLVGTVWGYGHVGDGRTVDVHIARLRRKLGPRYRGTIHTVRRVGYKYVPPAGR
ncbi:winged helix-turn-helix domain-containing protein [Streptomyces thermospinosisporus]|uniref:Winged helix-turn-helix domain-containing protein n=1 Tax=Streptomyces thermospinosisporus TaxID=161482 RepID=A0ABN1YX32_9ACTN